MNFRFKLMHNQQASNIGNVMLNRHSEAIVLITNVETNQVVSRYQFPRFNDEHTGLALWMANSAAHEYPYTYPYDNFSNFPVPAAGGTGSSLHDYIVPFDVPFDLSSLNTSSWMTNVRVPTHAVDFRLAARDGELKDQIREVYSNVLLP